MKTSRSLPAALIACAFFVTTPPATHAQPNPPDTKRDPGIVTSLQPLGGIDVTKCQTVYLGYVPGKVTSTNYWGLGTGNFVPGSTNAADYGYWGWDDDALRNNIAAVHGDSLFGWWPVRHRYETTAAMTLSDHERPWWAIDIGNNANYVINQGGGHKRTFGVVGVWHRDNGSASGGGVTWAALSGSFSLWCGLRRDGDNSFLDPITGNPFNARVLQYTFKHGGTAGGGIGTDQKFPGYASQWDQTTYRDINMGTSTTLKVRFRYRTNLSTGVETNAATRTGWFDKDPVAVTTANFISSTDAGASAPIDSFMVYVGAPVNDAACLYSDGATRSVYDPQRRWFDEVIRVNEPGKYTELMTVSGDHAAQQVTFTGINTSAFGSRVRLVFRNKTNRGFDDQTGSVAGTYNSGGAGAVVIDDVEVDTGSGFITIGDFESAAQVDNHTNVDPLTAWKTSGRPPAIYHHVHDLQSLVYEDVAGPPGSSGSLCKMNGNVISSGDHDQSEAAGGVTTLAEHELSDGIVSPTINLRNAGGPNEMGISDAIAAGNEYYVCYDVYTGIFETTSVGNVWRFGWQAYPGRQADGVPCWSDMRFPDLVLFDPTKQCFQDREPAHLYGLLVWDAASSAGGATYPDSMRVFLGKEQSCFRFGVTVGCSPTDGSYFDNVSVAFVNNVACLVYDPGNTNSPASTNGTPPPPTGQIYGHIWEWINDTFTVNGLNRNGVAPGTAAFDTTSALIKTGLNMAPAANVGRPAVPGDTSVFVATGGNLRVDLVFRIRPGPGNYSTIGNPNTSLRRVPTSTTAVNISGPTGTNFWEEYLIDNGAKGTVGGHPAAGVNGGKRWSPYAWNSARCDTAEQNIWPIQPRMIGGPTLGRFASMYHEADPKYVKLGIAKNRCFLTTATAAYAQANIVCDISLTDGWPITAGYVAESGLPLGRTYEYTKILPDGQFTPGTHVEYFVRREDTPIAGGPFLAPDTSLVIPQYGEGSLDAHRWQEFSVLPDAWKKAAYGGLGQACMLYVDLDDRRGDERVWVGVADSIGATRVSKWGAHNGWHAQDKVDVNNVENFVYENQQPGTTWDMFGCKASEILSDRVASIGAAIASPGTGLLTNKGSTQGPTLSMLNAYYRVLLILSGDLNQDVLGQFSNFSNLDTAMLESFLSSGTPGDFRGLWAEGEGFVESADALPSNTPLMSGYFSVGLRDASYTLLTGNTAKCIDLVTQSPITTNGDIYGIQNDAWIGNDVLDVLSGGVSANLYSPGGVNAPVVASVYHPVNATNGWYWMTLVDGWDIQSLRSRFCDKTHGRLAYAYNVLTDIFGAICQINGSPVVTLDVPNNASGGDFVDFAGLTNNPLRAGAAGVEFELAAPDRVDVRVYDVGGRLIRVLASRQFTAGRHVLTWDGTDDGGRDVHRGVYFTQVRYLNRGFNETKKLIVLR